MAKTTNQAKQNAPSKASDDKKKPEDKDEELSDEDLELKRNLELMIERVMEEDLGAHLGRMGLLPAPMGCWLAGNTYPCYYTFVQGLPLSACVMMDPNAPNTTLS